MSHLSQAAFPKQPPEGAEPRPFSHNLPAQPTPLIGREREVEAASERLRRPDVRLLTLIGPPGIGKTRLSIQAATELLPDFVDGVYFASLAPISDPALVASAIAQPLGVKEAPSQSLIRSLQLFFSDRQMLLVLDNFEQVVEAAPLLADLLESSPHLKVLVTSREGLHLYGEHDYPVPALSLPDLNNLPGLDVLSRYEAIALFLQRAQAVSPSFELTERNARAVAEICLRLDCLPLAIELAAARIQVLPPDELLVRLKSRLKLLTGGARNLPERQRTLQAAIDWSYDLLNPDEQTLLRRLSVFVAGCTLDAAEHVCGKITPGTNTLDGVSSLVGKSLLQRQPQLTLQDANSEGPRFVMLETIREYALERLEESGDAEDLRRRHAWYFLEFAEQAEPHLKGPQEVECLARLEDEHSKLRAALDWSQTTASVEGPEIGLRLASALWRYWEVRGYLTEGREWLTRTLAHDAATPHARDDGGRKTVQRARAGALNGAARLG